ncbi:glycosyltransferase family 2 protein [Caldimonas caldifontis]|uniref:Glycosyl transferase n=1 Tax=Caldimonas caldifontis TaxID=1452508 RepID=A0A2S5SS87_9BURK|nr:glycosyltransferase family A protein [Caldimonas caldifontis]PPE65554.1 glycosyl transferase [Caldimonas caldifontis]
MTRLAHVGVVAIGRNEGERLRRCLESVRHLADQVVYVDSGSTDHSVSMARKLGVECIELDLSIPFTAARARNAGWRRLLELAPEIRWVQFVDGDCEVVTGWLEQAQEFLAAHPKAAAVCGQRRERHPERSVYNQLCHLEWAKPPGLLKSFGGDVMLRREALEQVGGYRDDLIAGEEPELSVRIRSQGWELHALPAEMTLHDAAMTRFRQWWLRIVRSGYAYAAGRHLHGGPPERHCVRETWRTWVWALGPPAMAAALWPWMSIWALLVLGVYPLQVLRLYLRLPGPPRDRRLQATFHTLGRFPELVGHLQFWRDQMLGRRARLIEYK